MKSEKPITKDATREIIADFAKEIREKRKSGAKPAKEVIFFRNDRNNGIERTIWEVPIDILRFRKDNGRIASDVLTYESVYGPLKEESAEAQSILKRFLLDKDPEKTQELIKSIEHSSQDRAAIITADGFLINGNRRKVALESLYDKHKDSKYYYMKVVILPGEGEDGGPPTLKEIEEIENRYQLQSEGKAEYYNFDRALSIRMKIRKGITLEAQLKDDPNYANLSEKEFRKALAKFEDDFLGPVDSIDSYLSGLGRTGLYNTISTGSSDKEGRWQAFLDYHNHVKKKLVDGKKRLSLGIEEYEVGEIEEVAFKIIRKRDFPELPKAHQIMRDLPKWLENPRAKQELMKLLEVDLRLSDSEIRDKTGKEFDEREKDKIWGKKHEKILVGTVKRAKALYDEDKNTETPLALLEAALKKLEHKNLKPEQVRAEDFTKAMQISRKIQEVAGKIEGRFYELKKNRPSK